MCKMFGCYSQLLRFFLVVLCVMLVSKAYAEDKDREKDTETEVFTVEGVEIAADSGSLEDSKTIALENGANQAFFKLLHKILPANTPAITYEKLQQIPRNKIVALVKEYDVVSERLTSHSYMATLNIKFYDNAVKDVLNNLGIRHADKYTPQTLVIPVLYDEGKYIVWGRGEHGSVWNAALNKIGLFKFNVIEGELVEIETLDPKTMIIEPYSRFQPILQQYNATELIIIFGEKGNSKLEVSIRFVGRDHDIVKFIEYKSDIDETPAEYTGRVIDDVAVRLDTHLRGGEAFKEPKLYSSTVYVVASTPKVWSEVRNILSNLPQIKSYTLVQDRVNIIELELNYTVAPPIISAVLLQNGVLVVNRDGKIFLELSKKR
ncbi:exported hypothetical protein [Alphaproteobacteria bacterium]